MKVDFEYNNAFIKQYENEKKQESNDGPVSLHWLILGNLFKT